MLNLEPDIIERIIESLFAKYLPVCLLNLFDCHYIEIYESLLYVGAAE